MVVSNILDTSDAYRRGLRYGDQLLSFGGRPVTTVNSFKNVLGIFPRGWRVPMTFRHEGEIQEVSVRLAGVHSREELLSKIERAPDMPPGQPPLPKKRPADEPPKEGGDPEQPQPHPPMPLPFGAPSHREPPPAQVAKLIDQRPGYANYYFNALNQDRVWSACSKHGNFQDATGKWVIAGTLGSDAPFEITLGSEELTGQFPASRDRVDPRIDLDQQLLPVGSGGLLPALYLWRRMLLVGPKEFGETYYLGTTPLIDHDGLFDVLIGTHNVVEGHFAFDMRTGHLVALEMFPEANADPCEIYFSDYRPVQDRSLPHRMTVRFGNTVYAELLIERYELAK